MWSGIITWLLGLIVALVAVSKSPWALAALTVGGLMALAVWEEFNARR